MASVKRKAEDNPQKISNSKRYRTDDSKSSKTSANGKENVGPEPKPRKDSGRSILSKEQPLFPRGGADVLTPIERKQIHAQADRDATREHRASKDLFGANTAAAAASDDETSDIDEDATSTNVEPKQRKKKGSRKKASREEPVKSTTTKIGGLSYKRLAEGVLVFGQVTAISSNDVAVALPNGLVGYIPLASVSRLFNAKIQKLLERNQDQQTEQGADDDQDDISLDSLFFLGQQLRVAVTSTGQVSAPGGQSKRRIELSSEPELVNAGLNKASLANNVMVQAAISSVEDHGLVVELGLEDYPARGFIPAKSLPPGKSMSDMREGAVLLCQVADITSNGQVIKLSADSSKQRTLKSAPTIDSFLPGTVADVLISEIQDAGLVGKIMGMLDVTADIIHSGSYQDKEAFIAKYPLGKKVRGRLLFALPAQEDARVGFSLLPHLVDPPEEDNSIQRVKNEAASSMVDSATVLRVEHGLGIYLDLGSDRTGFAHISRLADSKVENLSETTGTFKVSSEHKARILEYNPIDGLYIVSLQNSVLTQPYLRIEDVPVGKVVKGTIERVIVGASGVSGIIVKLADGVSGLVPEIHLSDVALQHPEKKFRDGLPVKARVLSVDLSKRQIRLTLKKTLVNSDARIWDNFSSIKVGDTSFGTLVKVDSNGALVQFYGKVRGFLPVAEMSEAYIKDAREHFRLGQVVTVNAVSVSAEDDRLTVSCREASSGEQQGEASLTSVKAGTIVSGVVFEKAKDDLLLRLQDSGVIARLSLDHVSDGSTKKRQSALSKIRVGQKLEGLLVLDVQPKQRLVILCNRQSVIKAAQAGQLLNSFENLEPGRTVIGSVSNITADGVFVSFASGITGLITARGVPLDSEGLPDFGMKKLQTVSSRILNVDYKGATPRFWLTMRDKEPSTDQPPTISESVTPVVDPVDPSLQSEEDLVVDRITKARIVSVKDSQLNVELAKNLQGRIDVSELFDRWEDIKDRKKPLRQYSFGQILSVRVIGAHDTRNHRFLPLTHRKGKNTVFELTAKTSSLSKNNTDLLSYSDLEPESSWLAFVNNVAHDYVWVNISPSVRGRLKAVDVSDDLSQAGNLGANFPIGSALRVRVLAVDANKGRLDLTARTGEISKNFSFSDLSPGLILPGRVTKVSDRQVIIQLNDDLIGAVDLIDVADDYAEVDPAKFQKHEIVRVCVLKVDAPNKKVMLSLRPSRVLSSSITPTDPEITSVEQLQVDEIYRGFIRNVDDKGLFVNLGHGVTAFVRVAHLSDAYLKEWKDSYQRDQLVQGKIIKIDKSSGHVQMSLKASVLSGPYTPPMTFDDLKVGDVVTGKAAKVEEFGVFMVVDNSENVRGLCHRSEIAERRIEDARKLFSEGDALKAKVLKIDVDKRRISFGLKASYFEDEVIDEEESGQINSDADSDELGGALLDAVMKDEDNNDSEAGGGAEDSGLASDEFEREESDTDESVTEAPIESNTDDIGLKVGGFDWFGLSAGAKRSNAELEARTQTQVVNKKRKKRAEIQVDHTGDLDANGPQSVADYERLLLGEPDSSLLWLQYMAFHLELGDADQAREIGERALKSIGLGQEAEKMNVWVALLNLENAYGDEETIEAVFKRACDYNDAQEMHSRLTSIYIHSGKKEKADDMFQKMLKKFTQDPKIWINYATFLFDTAKEPDRGRELLPRALQILPKFSHLDLTSKFAQLEFKSEPGLAERGRTIFEGLIASFPKRIDLYNVLLDLELKVDDKEQIRSLFERIFRGKLKPKQAKYFFKRWLAFEEKEGDERKIEDVKAKAATWIRATGSEGTM